MAITTYAELQAAVAAYHHRDDGHIVEHIDIAEARINSLLFSRMGETEASLSSTPHSRTITLPTDFLRPLGLWLTQYGSRQDIIYVTPENLPVYTDSEGQPAYYTIDQNTIAFEYPADQVYSFVLRYKKGYRIATTLTNFALDNYPQAYLYGAVREAAVFSDDDNSAQKYEMLFQQAIDEAMKIERGNRTQATLAADPAISGRRITNIINGGV